MNETDILTALQKSGAGMQTVATVGVCWIGWRVSRVEKQVNAIAQTVNACPTCRRHASIVPLILAAAALLLTAGCVQTRVKFGEAEMTRTALLTRVEVPAIEVATNGTFKASVKSDARTELLEAVIRLLATAPK